MFLAGRKKLVLAACIACCAALPLVAEEEGAGAGSAQSDSAQPAAHEVRQPNRVPPGFRNRALTVHIVARVFEKDSSGDKDKATDGSGSKDGWREVWTESRDQNTIPGVPVTIQLAGANIVVAVQLTPYIKKGGESVLVAQGQVWTEDENHNVQYQTAIQSIPLVFGEEIYFFPVGERNDDSNDFIEICIVLNRYNTKK